jgi:hypothetical protein
MMININDRSSLVDICDISIDKSLTKTERITEYVRQIKNPYNFKCGEFIINAIFSMDGPTLEECLHRLMT